MLMITRRGGGSKRQRVDIVSVSKDVKTENVYEPVIGSEQQGTDGNQSGDGKHCTDLGLHQMDVEAIGYATIEERIIERCVKDPNPKKVSPQDAYMPLEFFIIVDKYEVIVQTKNEKVQVSAFTHLWVQELEIEKFVPIEVQESERLMNLHNDKEEVDANEVSSTYKKVQPQTTTNHSLSPHTHTLPAVSFCRCVAVADGGD
ncbi:hypothetical protein L6452_43660 [Arctium lappa]|uniref:Uncharacterized protein n=1 Tax=Arctium lappa TaxID=4217 RepID=A0ACB8XDW6_ARCLA|nr:hypothetical protein L6452_43660 [Arctium lappa]